MVSLSEHLRGAGLWAPRQAAVGFPGHLSVPFFSPSPWLSLPGPEEVLAVCGLIPFMPFRVTDGPQACPPGPDSTGCRDAPAAGRAPTCLSSMQGLCRTPWGTWERQMTLRDWRMLGAGWVLFGQKRGKTQKPRGVQGWRPLQGTSSRLGRAQGSTTGEGPDRGMGAEGGRV